MTDTDLIRFIRKFDLHIPLGAITVFDNDENTVNKTSNRRAFVDVQRNTVLLDKCYNSILGIPLRAHNITVRGNAFSFHDIAVNMNEFVADYEEARLKSISNEPIDNNNLDVYTLTTVYTFDEGIDKLKIPGFNKINNKNINTVFQATLRKTLVERGYNEEDYKKERIAFYISEDEHQIIRITNTLITGRALKTSNFEYLASNRYTNPGEHIFLALLPVLVSNIKEQLNDDELNLFKEFTHPFNFNVGAIKNLLRALFSSDTYKNLVKVKELEQLKRMLSFDEVRRYDTQIDDLKRRIEEQVEQLLRLEKHLADTNKDKLLATCNTEGVDEKIEYIANHPYIVNFDLQDRELWFKTRTPLSMWDPEAAETVFKNINKIMENADTREAYKDYIRFFFKAVFIDQIATYWMAGRCAIFLFDYTYHYSNHNSVHAPDYIANLRALEAGYNPHIEHFNCQGTHKAELNKAATSRDLLALIEALLNPLKNLNLTDGIVVSEFVKTSLKIFIEQEIPCLEYESKMYTIQDLYDLIEKQNTIEVQDATYIGEVEETEEDEEEL